MGRIGKTVLVAAVAFAVAAPAALAGGMAENQTAVESLAAGVLVQLNQIRVAHGLVPLRLDAQLSAAAAGHCSQMLTDGYFAHDSVDGSPFWKRLTAYTSTSTTGAWSVGENLLSQAPDVDAAQALELWMASPDHRANILNTKWRQIGISAIHADEAPGVYDNQPVTVVTTDFGVLG
jgi:uncharacterized protein YkwD